MVQQYPKKEEEQQSQMDRFWWLQRVMQDCSYWKISMVFYFCFLALCVFPVWLAKTKTIISSKMTNKTMKMKKSGESKWYSILEAIFNVIILLLFSLNSITLHHPLSHLLSYHLKLLHCLHPHAVQEAINQMVVVQFQSVCMKKNDNLQVHQLQS